MNRVRWTQRALQDLVEIGDFIAQDKPEAARAWVERLRQCAFLAAHTPNAGRKVPEVNRDDVRETFLRSYRILYQVVSGAIVVLTVIEGHRRLPGISVLDESSGERKAKPEATQAKPSMRLVESKTSKKKRAGTQPRTNRPRAGR